VDYNEDSMECFIDSDFITITDLLKEATSSLIIDGKMCTAGDMKLIADTFDGERIIFVEMELTEKQLLQLCKWKGDIIEFNLCGHNDYDLNMFFNIMNRWYGHTLLVQHQYIHKITSVINPCYRQLVFNNCKIEDINDFKDNIYTLIIQ
jgi:hypothetical protein